MLEKLFQLQANGTNVRREAVAGLTTFLTMAYIIFVNPAILQLAGMDFGAVFMATCLAAAFGSAFMGLYANYPIALAPGMGLNAYFTFGVVKGMGYSWETALGAVFISGLIFLALSLLKVREWIVNAIPMSMKLGIAAGIGLFLAIIALQNARIVVAHPATLVTIGDLKSLPVLLAALGFALITALSARKIPGAIIISILAVTAIAVGLGVAEFKGIASTPPSIAPTFMAMDIKGALEIGLWTIIFVFLFVDLFDNTGTLIGIAHQGGFLDKDGKLPRIGRALVVDSDVRLCRSGSRHVDDDELHRERRRRRGGRTHGPHRCRRRPVFSAGDVLRAARGNRARVRDGAGAALRRLPHGARIEGYRLGRPDRIRARHGDGDRDAAHLLHRPRHRRRLHRLCGDQDSRRPMERHEDRRADHRRPVHPEDFRDVAPQARAPGGGQYAISHPGRVHRAGAARAPAPRAAKSSRACGLSKPPLLAGSSMSRMASNARAQASRSFFSASLMGRLAGSMSPTSTPPSCQSG